MLAAIKIDVIVADPPPAAEHLRHTVLLSMPPEEHGGAGAFAVLRKPFDIVELVRTVKACAGDCR